MKNRALALSFCLVFLLFSGMSCLAAEKKWPDASITMIVPFNAGGGLDATARLLAKHWEKELGTRIVVENRGGAGGQVGTTYFMGLPDDGNNILIGVQLMYSMSILKQNAPYTIDDVTVLNFQEVDPECLFVAPDSPYQSIADLDAAIKANPGKIRFGVTPGSAAEIMVKYLEQHFKWDIKIVHYDGAPQQKAAVMGKHVEVANCGLLTSTENERLLVMWADSRNPARPDTPVLKEVLGKDLPFVGTSRFVGVHSTLKEKHPDRYKILLETLEKTHRNAEYKQAVKDAGRDIITHWYGPEESDKMNRRLHEFALENPDTE